MSGSLLTAAADEFSALWCDYWQNKWHRPIGLKPQQLACFLSAEDGRSHLSYDTGDGLITNYPRGLRPFLGVVTTSRSGGSSAVSGVLEYNDAGHLLTIAPTRAGKGTAQIVPNLLLYAGSCLVIDIKGENYAVTATHRRAMFPGATVLKFAPFEDNAARYNPFDFVRTNADGTPNSYTFDDTRLLAEMLIATGVNESFWDIEARNLLTMVLLYVATRYAPGDIDRTMRTVMRLLFPTWIEGDKSAIEKTIRTIAIEADESDHHILEALVTQFLEHEEKVGKGILSTCRSAMSIWLSERLQTATSTSDFQFSDLKRSMCRPIDENPAPTTLYLSIPPENLREYRPIMRMIVGLATIELTRPNKWEDKPGWQPKPPAPVLFLLDEFPALGHISPIEQGVAYLAGYGVQVWTFAQSIGQLKAVYGENWTTFVANAGAASYFGITDPDLAEQLSKQLGTTEEYGLTYETKSFSVSDNEGSSDSHSSTSGYKFEQSSTSSSFSTSTGSSSSETTTENVRFKQQPVALASDIRAMPPELQLILLRNKRPVLATLLPYFQCELFGSLYGTWNR